MELGAYPPGLSVLRFAPTGEVGAFSDWSEAPLLVARRLMGMGGAVFLDALAPGASPDEVEAFARGLQANGSAEGERRLVRKRFSAL